MFSSLLRSFESVWACGRAGPLGHLASHRREGEGEARVLPTSGCGGGAFKGSRP